jgi:microcystin-dependent protein
MLVIGSTRTSVPVPIQTAVPQEYVRPIDWSTATPYRMDEQVQPSNPKQAEIDYLTQSLPYGQDMSQTDANLAQLLHEAGQGGSTVFLDPNWKAQVYSNMDREVDDTAALAALVPPPDMVQLQMLYIDMHSHAVLARSYMTTGLENIDPNSVAMASQEEQAIGTDVEQATAFLKAYKASYGTTQ